MEETHDTLTRTCLWQFQWLVHSHRADEVRGTHCVMQCTECSRICSHNSYTNLKAALATTTNLSSGHFGECRCALRLLHKFDVNVRETRHIMPLLLSLCRKLKEGQIGQL